MKKRITRSNSNKIIAGVCGGLAEYFNIDATLIRLAWILSLFIPGFPGIFAYLICVFLIPQGDDIIHQDEEKYTYNNTSIFLGLGLLVIGAFMLLREFLPHYFFNFRQIFRFWPVLLIVFGLYIIFTNKRD